MKAALVLVVLWCAVCTGRRAELRQAGIRTAANFYTSFASLFHVEPRLEIFQRRVPKSKPFPCDVTGARSSTPPTSVHKLRPGDIDVVAAMGDSLTAGNGLATVTVPEMFINYRGMTWSIGGDKTWREYYTLPNILKEFNPRIFGYSRGTSYSYSRVAQFNTAVAGAVDQEMPYQAKVLVRRIKADPRVDVHKDWKLITILIGANDICGESCFDNTDARQHYATLKATLDYLRNNLPRTFVNLVATVDVVNLSGFEKKSWICSNMHKYNCPCLFRPGNILETENIRNLTVAFRKAELRLAEDKSYDREDFTVVYQPALTKVFLPKKQTRNGPATDTTFVAPDCFHPSQKSGAAVAVKIWNNMLEPVGYKTEEVRLGVIEDLKCPSESSPYLFTRRNSEIFKRTKRQLEQEADGYS